MNQYVAIVALIAASILSLITVPLLDLFLALYEAAWKRHMALVVLALFVVVFVVSAVFILPVVLVFWPVRRLGDMYGLALNTSMLIGLGIYLAQWVLIAWGYEMMKRPYIKRFL